MHGEAVVQAAEAVITVGPAIRVPLNTKKTFAKGTMNTARMAIAIQTGAVGA
ncbi:hypothetical protein DPMN_153338 [Dreissena polymorpha]|uniref:Uncharacterized protein n=1 Tax=Dreissena polymorpha TaxID=45954 RepID=A0A9D4FNP8_DREPO|nr:hypothetical protein DPMN_153338 [Dreissena polymorpha]